MTESITGKTLIGWGFAPGKWFAEAIAAANEVLAAGGSEEAARHAADNCRPAPTIPLQAIGETPILESIEVSGPDDIANLEAVRETMRALARTPNLAKLAVMPDACPAGSIGTIPVGGVAATRGTIHPGMHSADICCSVAITIVGRTDPRALLDAGAKVTHFGGGGRNGGNPSAPSDPLLARFERNPFLSDVIPEAMNQFATQGDGNHFFYVGTLRSTGETAIVTHHGSRKPGEMLYKRGMAAAERHRIERSPETLKQNAWLDFDSAEGGDYWEALQIMREWTKQNHFAIHDMTLEAAGVGSRDRFWNEHNFVFRRGDMFLHGKGATPAWRDYAEDSSGAVLIPLNMAAPVLIAEGSDNPNALGFCPHGAGRNYSRREHMRRNTETTIEAMVEAETAGLDVRFHCGIPDASELPSAYKSADAIIRQIEQFELARIVDQVDPYGSIMAGDWQRPFIERRNQRLAEKTQ